MSRVRLISADELREPNTYASVGVVRISREDLPSRGVALKPLDDPGYLIEAGPVEEALVETDTPAPVFGNIPRRGGLRIVRLRPSGRTPGERWVLAVVQG